MTKEKRAC